MYKKGVKMYKKRPPAAEKRCPAMGLRLWVKRVPAEMTGFLAGPAGFPATTAARRPVLTDFLYLPVHVRVPAYP
jgi:hypothetical protein